MIKATNIGVPVEEEAVIVDVDDSETLVLEAAPSTSGVTMKFRLLNEQYSRPRHLVCTKRVKVPSLVSEKDRNYTYHFNKHSSDEGEQRYVAEISSSPEDGDTSCAPHDDNRAVNSVRLLRPRRSFEYKSRFSGTFRDQWREAEKEDAELHCGRFIEEILPSGSKSISKRSRGIGSKRLYYGSEKQWLLNERLDKRGFAKKKQSSCDVSHSPTNNTSIPIFSARSKRLTLSSVVVPEEDEQLVRVYRFNSRSRDGRTMYYRCSKCDTLCNNDKKSGTVRKTVSRASLKTVNGQIVGNAHPKHHPDCKPISAQTLKAQEIDKSCRVRVKEGVLTPKQAWSMGRQMAMEQSGNEDSNAEVVPFPDWKKLRRKYSELGRIRKVTPEQSEQLVYDDDDINVGSIESVPMQCSNSVSTEAMVHSCNCKQFYEANVQIHESIVNCLEEIRAIRDEVRQLYDESKHFEVDESLYQVINEP